MVNTFFFPLLLSETRDREQAKNKQSHKLPHHLPIAPAHPSSHPKKKKIKSWRMSLRVETAHWWTRWDVDVLWNVSACSSGHVAHLCICPISIFTARQINLQSLSPRFGHLRAWKEDSGAERVIRTSVYVYLMLFCFKVALFTESDHSTQSAPKWFVGIFIYV